MNKEFKGTEGEWKVTHDTNNIECNNEVILLCGYLRNNDDTQLGGESWLSMRERTSKDRQDIEDERLANAKIAAASKELLKALQGMVDLFHVVVDSPNEIEQEQAIIKSQQAINKALN